MPVSPISDDGFEQEPEYIPDSRIKQFADITESSTLEDPLSQESRLYDSSYTPYDDSSFLTSSGEGSWGDFLDLPWRGLREDDFVHDGDSMELVVGVDVGGFSIAGVSGSVFDVISKYEGKVVNTVSKGGFSIASGSNLLAYVVDVSLEDVKAFTEEAEDLSSVRYVEPNYRYKIAAVPNDPDYSQQWGLQKIEAEKAWDIQTGSKDVIVAVIDTGIDYDHLDLSANYHPLGYDWVNDDSDPMDNNGHGTHVAGIIAAITNNSYGVSGIAQVKIMAEKGLNANGNGNADDLANSIIHAVDVGADIISCSWGDWFKNEFGSGTLVHEAVKYAHDNDVLIIASAGNNAITNKNYPAAFDEVIAVTATDSSDLPASFTNWGEWVEIAAPGVDIYSTVWDDSYMMMSGTSMSSPLVAGVAALILSQYPDMSAEDIRRRIQLSADDLGIPGYDYYYGYGRINAFKAVYTPPHDLYLISQKMPNTFIPGKTAVMNITIMNWGNNTETNVKINLIVNGTTANSTTIPIIVRGAFKIIQLAWTPTDEGVFNITSYILPVIGEGYIENNFARSKIIHVRQPINILWERIHYQLGPNLTERFSSLVQILGREGYEITEISEGYVNIELLSNYDILVVMKPEQYFLITEIQAIHQWIKLGGKMLLIPNHVSRNNVNELSKPYGIDITIQHTYEMDETRNIALHPVTRMVSSLWYDFPVRLNVDPKKATILAWTNMMTPFLAISNNVTVLSDGNLMSNYNIFKNDNQNLVINIFQEIGKNIEHDLSVSVESPKRVSPNEIVEVNISVANLGNSVELDIPIKLYIDNNEVFSYTIPRLNTGSVFSYIYYWTPTYEKQYNITALCVLKNNEKISHNNKKSILVPSYTVSQMYVAIFQDKIPWDYNSNEIILSMYDMSYNVYSSDNFNSVNINEYDKIIIAGDQEIDFYSKLSDSLSKFIEYVNNGGILELHVHPYMNDANLTLPAGLEFDQAYPQDITVVNKTHPIVNKPYIITDDESIERTSMQFTNFPDSSTFIINTTINNLPVYVEIKYGKGTIIASTLLLEWKFQQKYSNFLVNSLLYNPRYTLSYVDKINVTLNFNAGWNMISLSVVPEDVSASDVLDGVGYYQLVTWSGTGYLAASDFESGRGYWLLVLEDVNVTVSGIPVDEVTLTLSLGWSMIGGPNSVVQAADVFPGFYQLVTWTGTGYTPATVFEPGKGYWALVLEETQIQLPPV